MHRRALAQALLEQTVNRKPKRRGRFFSHLVPQLISVVEEALEGWANDKDAKVTAQTLMTVLGLLSTRASHRFLARVLRESELPSIRGEVLTAMAFEAHPLFKARLILPFLRSEHIVDEVLSSLYALSYKRLSHHQQEQVLANIAHLAHHPYPLIPGYVGNVLTSIDQPEQALDKMIRNAPSTDREALIVLLEYIQGNEEVQLCRKELERSTLEP